MSKEFREGEHEFHFLNGDKYEGQYCAHVSGLAWRQGRGTYYTHDGQIYEGLWKNDKLDETQNLQITYQNRDTYMGKISKCKYNGPGTYWFNNNSRLSCQFVNNKPFGDVIYIDHHNRLWYGVAGNDSVMLNREHVFSYELDSERGKGVPLNPPPIETHEEAVEPEEVQEEIDWKEVERQVFAKSTKTPSDINFEDSEWFRDFEKFTEMYRTVMEKVQHRGTHCLSEEEKVWYKKFLHTARILDARKKGKRRHRTGPRHSLKEYLTEELKDTCPPTFVLRSTQIGEREQVEQ